MADYAKKSFGMFGGEEQTVKLLVHNSLAGVIIDRFGKDVMMIPADKEYFTVNVEVHVSRQFLGWVFSLGKMAKIVGPEEVIGQMQEEVIRLQNEYFQNQLGTNANLVKANQALKSMKGLENRKYKPRKYEELFENCVMKEKHLQKDDLCSEQICQESEKKNFDRRSICEEESEKAVEERIYTPFDGKENDWMSFAKQQAEFYRHDFVYEDDFSQSTNEYILNSGQYDDAGNRLVVNTESNGRFHTDWLNMMYPRLKLAKNLLTDDGAIFISIDDNEQSNLVQVCNEVFGAENCIGPIIQNKQNAKNDTVNVQKNHEFILVYRKMSNSLNGSITPTLSRKVITYRDAFEENGRFYYLNDPITTRGEGGTLNARPNLGYTVYFNPVTRDKIAVADYDIALAKTLNDEDKIYSTDKELLSKGYVAIRPPRVRGKLGCWTWALEKFNKQKDEIIITGKSGAYAVRKRTFVNKDDVLMIDGKMRYAASSMANSRSILDFSTNDGTNTLNAVLGKNAVFNNPKNLEMIKYLIQLLADKSFIVLDFFSGSATTAQAVMQANMDDGGNRQFIMVQLPEETDAKSEAYKAGYKNICEIGKERIRRAGIKIKEESPITTQDLDIGFRVLKCDTSNMKDVYYSPAEYEMNLLDLMTDNIKEDRTPEDLLFQVMLDLGVELSSKIEKTVIAGKKVFDVADGFLIACFDEDVTDETIKAIAQKQPYYFVMRDSFMANDSVATNFEQIFATYSPDTVRKVL